MSIGFKVGHKESTEVTPVIEQQITEDSFGEPSKMAHIVMAPMGRFRKNKRKKSPQAMVLEARIKGTPLTALCGYTWVPSQNPEHLPKCAKCVLIYQTQHLRNEKIGGCRMLKLLAKFFSKADPFEWEEDDPEVTDLLLAIDSATTEAAKCAVDNDWSGVYRSQALVRKLNYQLYEHRLLEALDEEGALDGTDS